MRALGNVQESEGRDDKEPRRRTARRPAVRSVGVARSRGGSDCAQKRGTGGAVAGAAAAGSERAAFGDGAPVPASSGPRARRTRTPVRACTARVLNARSFTL